MFICILLSYTLEALPASIEDMSLISAVADTTKEKEEKTKSWDIDFDLFQDENDDDDKEYTQRQNVMRIGMVDLGISSYIDENGSLDMPDELDYMDQRLFRSINFGLHLINIKFGLNKKEKPQRLGISAGIKWNVVHYSMEKDYQLNKDQENYLAAIDYDVPALKKNRLKANYIQLPFMLEYNSRPNRESKSFNIGIGYVHQLLLNSNYKYKTEDGVKVKTKGEYNMTKSMGLIEGRIGYGPLNFYAQYGLKNLFQEGDGPNLTPINFGVNIIPR